MSLVSAAFKGAGWFVKNHPKAAFRTGVIGTGFAGYKGVSAFDDYQYQKDMSRFGDAAASQEYADRHQRYKNIRRGLVLGGIGVAGVGIMGGAVIRAGARFGTKAAGAGARGAGKLLGTNVPGRAWWKKERYGFAAGALAGGAASLSGTGRGKGLAPEGTITGISSSIGGGISPELQFSTQGLTLGIHSRRKRRVM